MGRLLAALDNQRPYFLPRGRVISTEMASWTWSQAMYHGSMTVLLGKGDGTFTALPAVSIDPLVFTIRVGDFNGDGIPDLAVPNYFGDAVNIWLGKGDGTFTLASTSSTGALPIEVEVDDFNGDGIADLVVGNFGDNTLTVLLGKGDGTFTLHSSPAIGIYPGSVRVGDFNGDGEDDILVTGELVLLNQITETVTATLSNVSVPDKQTHLIKASYPGDDNFTGSASGTVALNTPRIATTLNLSSSLNPSSLGSQITLTATLTPYSMGSFTTNGENVTFYNGGTSIGTGTLSSGVATLNTTSLPVGTDTLTARFSGDTNFSGSISGAVVQTVSQVATSLQLSSSANPSMAGNQIALTATLSPYLYGTFTTNGETVTFYNGGTSIGTGVLSSGVATLNSSSLPVGTDTLTANFPGNANFAAATSNSIAQVVEGPKAATPVFSPGAGFYASTQQVTITDTTPEATIYYTSNGMPPTTSSAVYTSGHPITVTNSETLKAIAVATNYAPSAVATATYSFAAAEPVFSVASGTYTSPQTVSITDTTPGATIYYTTDGTVPSRSSPIYTSTNPISVSATTVIKALAVAPSYLTSPEGAAKYIIIPPYAATPVFSRASGYFTTPQTVSISDTTPGAIIYYTTNGMPPTTSSTMYTGRPHHGQHHDRP